MTTPAAPSPTEWENILGEAHREIEELQKKLADQASIEEATGQQAMALLYNEIRLRTILDNISDGIFTLNEDGTVASISSTARHIFGYEENEMDGFQAFSLFPEREQQRFKNLCTDVLGAAEYQVDGLREETYGFAAVTSTGQEFAAEISLSKASFNDETMLLLVVRDVREQAAAKAAEEEKSKLVRLMRQVAVAANESPSLNAAVKICLHHICDYTNWPVGHCYTYDTGLEQLVSSKLWYVEDDRKYKSFQEASEILSPPIGRSWIGDVYRASKPSYVVNIAEAPAFLRSDAARECSLGAAFAFPILVGQEVVAVMEFFADTFQEPNAQFLETMEHIGTQLGRVTERERAARQLTEEKEKAEAANVSKSEFLANMSHELRTPMNGVLGMIQILEDTTLSEDQQHYATRIHKSAEGLLNILNDILDFSKIEADMLELEGIPFIVHDVVQEVVDLFTPQALDKGIVVAPDFKGDPGCVTGDPNRIRQLLTNLVSNAIKFTEEGQVTIEVTPRLSGGENNIMFRVTDTGCGIAQEDMAKVFNKFTQADASTTRQFGGTGLGLAICKKLVGLMGGVMGLDSELGKGSTFWFSLPLPVASLEDAQQVQIATEPELSKTSGIPANQAKILLVEDDPVNREVATRFLAKMGFGHVDIAEDGQQGVDAVAQNTYDLVMMDCSMPVMDGFTASQTIRATEKDGEHLPIVAATANAMVGDRERCLKSGMDDYVSKPIKAPELKRVLGRWIAFEEQNDSLIDTPQAEEGPQQSNDAPVDMEHLFSFTDGDADVLQELTNLFFETVEECIKNLEKHTPDAEQEGWKAAAHRLKGAAGNLGAMKLHGICFEAEQGFEKDENFKQTILASIQEEVEEVVDFLQKSTG